MLEEELLRTKFGRARVQGGLYLNKSYIMKTIFKMAYFCT